MIYYHYEFLSSISGWLAGEYIPQEVDKYDYVWLSDLIREPLVISFWPVRDSVMMDKDCSITLL